MATATTSAQSAVDTAADQVTELNERFVETSKRFGNLYLDSYEKAVQGVTDFQLKIAAQADNDAVQNVVETQVDLTRELAKAYVGAAREVLS